MMKQRSLTWLWLFLAFAFGFTFQKWLSAPNLAQAGYSYSAPFGKVSEDEFRQEVLKALQTISRQLDERK